MAKSALRPKPAAKPAAKPKAKPAAKPKAAPKPEARASTATVTSPAEMKLVAGLPVPEKENLRGRPRRYPFDRMKVGEMFFLPGAEKRRYGMITTARHAGEKLNREFSVRVVHMTDSLDGPQIAAEDTPGAVLGLGVWRTA